MVTEIAYITIDPARAAAFQAAVAEASAQFRAFPGCHAMRLERVVEDAGQYRLVVSWDSVETHMVAFREAPNFARWRELAGPFFLSPPKVEHWEVAGDHF